MIGRTMPQNWAMVRIADAGASCLGLQRSPSRHFGENMKPYLRVANVFEAHVDTADLKQMHFTVAEAERFRLRKGDILLNEGQSPDFLGRPAIWTSPIEEMYFTNSLIRFRAAPTVLPQWALLVFRHYMHSGRFRRESRITTNIAHLALGRFQSVEFPVPPVAEQRRIIDELERRLSHVDAAIAYLRAADIRLRRARLSTLRVAASGELVGADDAAAWTDTSLGEVSNLVKNGIFVSRPGTDPVGPAILRISAVRPLALDTSDVRYAGVSDDQAKPYFLEPDDLLFVRYNGNAELVGACARVPTLDQPTMHPDKLIRVVVDRSQALPAFIEIAVAQGPARDAIRSASKTTAGQTGIAGGELRRVPLRLPDLELQHRIVEEAHRRLSLLSAAERIVQRETRRCEQLRRSLLAAAFAGRLVPQDPSDEPAEALLERIKASRSEGDSAGRRRSPRKEKVS